MKTCLSDLNEFKINRLTHTVVDFLVTGLHDRSEFHEAFVINALSDSIYKFSGLLYTGKISEKAQEALDSRKIIRAQLCKEHPKSRRESAIALINTFDYHRNRGSNTAVIKTEIRNVLITGSQINLVLSEENVALVPYQKLGYDPDVCYKLAGITLVDDRPREPEREYHYQGRVYKTQPEIVRDLKISITTVRRRIKKGLITVERKAA
jgi:hypothetical protein